MIEWILNLFTIEYWFSMINQIAAMGMFAGIGLAMLEAFIPPLPLILFVTINVVAFGFWIGYIYSWIGTVIGSIIVFLIIKKFGQKKFAKMIVSNKKIRSLFLWIREKGFIPIFFLLTFPFTPSIIICGLAALADIKNREYITALILGKTIMVFSLSFIGYNVQSFFTQPIKSILLIFLTFSVSFVGKNIVKYYERKENSRKKHRKCLELKNAHSIEKNNDLVNL